MGYIDERCPCGLVYWKRMHMFRNFLSFALFLALFSFSAMTVHAAVGASLGKAAGGLPFGGTVTTVTPCLNGNIMLTVKGSFPFPQPLIWTPGTDTRLHGPPKSTKVAITGLYKGVATCQIAPYIYIPGFSISLEGNSLLGSTGGDNIDI